MTSFASDIRRARKRFALTAAATTAVTALTLMTAGCSSVDDWSTPRDSAPVSSSLPAAFLAPDAMPSPAATITPQPDSWAGAEVAAGYRVVLLEADHDPTSAALADGVRRWAHEQGASLKSVRAASPDEEVAAISEAMDLHADLIVSASPALVDALALVTASHLDEQFLLIGAQLPEPTENVTAAVWAGASTRGSEVANPADADVVDAYTASAAERAAAAGAAAVVHGLTGIVIDVR
ncbi:hypothetical protein QF046_003045 [Microbacterium sp. W4I4]|uniref:hypothetical protein n=1 Tax=Microbacterium sp. W4I4 TaxID=3042295 RepID=UPI00278AF2F9|nr:hypothetical protein [Microbacterium sp. W4I4]MDQ0615404.1 hypothetical protein [Microbacterium sp. W4I4]